MTSPSPNRERPWERLQAFTAAHELALAVHRVTRQWLKQDEANLDLVQEARTAARAAPLLIMEGVEQPPGGFRRCLSAASGKLARLSSILVLARDVGLLSPEAFTDLEIRRDHAQRVTRGLWRAVGQRGSKPTK
jgi:four helix bundle protein